MIKFIDLNAQQTLIKEKIKKRIDVVLDHGQYILGPEINELQIALATFSKTKYVLCCSSGTDALLLSLLGLGFRPQEGVIVPSFTFASSAEVVPMLGGIPIFADVDKNTFNLSPDNVLESIHTAKKHNIKIKGIMTVGLFGQPCDMDSITSIAKEHKLWVLDDAAQSFGAQYKNIPVGSFGEVCATSFFPAKPLGCYGDGGALLTNNKKIFDIAYSCHLHGMSKNKYKYERIGMNGRMDSIQAAVLIEKLSIFEKELIQRQKIAENYKRLFNHLKTPIVLPKIIKKSKSSWAQFTIKLPNNLNRDLLQQKLIKKGIPTAIYYPIPLHKQKPYKNFPIPSNDLKNTNLLSKNVISLPMHPYLTLKDIEYITFNFNKILLQMI